MTARSQKNGPALRFKDDDGRDYPEWENNFLGELFEINAGGDIQKTHLRKTRDSVFCYPVYANAENFKGLHGYSDRYQVSKDCITVSGRGVGIGTAHARFEKFYPIVRLLVMHPKNACNLMFFEYAINELRIFNESTGVPQLTSPQLKTYRINFPDVEEQQKIASFLSAVDTKIEQLNRKKSLLEQYKKGMMQKLFIQEIRFKDENGGDYPDWEEKNLRDAGKTFNGLTGKSSEHFGSGKHYIQYLQVFENSKIDIKHFGFVEINENESQNLVRCGDVFFTISSETPQDVGVTSVLLNEVKDTYLNSFCFGYRVDRTILSPEFARYAFRENGLRKEIIRLAQGSTRYNLSKHSLMKLKIRLPILQEQQKIANFLSTIDRKIELVAGHAEQVRSFKQGLLQQMLI